MVAALGLSFTGCDPLGPKAAHETIDGMDPEAMAPDELVGVWRSFVPYTSMVEPAVTYEVEAVLTVADDLAAEIAVSLRYDAPGTQYDELEEYSLGAAIEALGGAKYRISVDDVDQAGKVGSVMQCTLTGDTLACDFTDPGFTDMQFVRQD